jgi:hypothetical protein
MKVSLKKITIRELIEDYKNHLEEGVSGYGGKLDIRPPYQREFVYNEKQQQSVVNTVSKNFPLNIMYWAVRQDGTYEIIDGQQRTLSICKYVNGDFSHDNKYFDNLWDEEKDAILDYSLDIYLCEGTEAEKLEWFRTINIAGEKLTEQELRNAVYHGPWVTDAKRYFSKTSCPAYLLANDYMNGTPIRQDYLEAVIDWVSNGKIEDHMAKNQKTENAEELWKYFESVIEWTKKVFKVYRREMKGLPWGTLYNSHKSLVDNEDFDADAIETRVKILMADEDVTKKSGIYHYILTNDEKYLNIRTFSPKQRTEAYTKQNGICKKCNKHFDIKEMDADHITPWVKGGQTTLENCQMLCKSCNRRKSSK